MFRTYFTSSFSGLPGTIVFRGYIDCSGNPNYPAANSGDMYVVSVAGKIGGASGIVVEVGDQITCITDNAGGTQVAAGNDFSIAQANITYVPENAALKDTANGYPGLTTFKINFLNFLGTFTSYLQNTNTASRLYSFQDRDGTIADNTDLALKQDLSGKDTTGGYVGLTLFKINFKNVANTFTSFFTNSNTAARTYTFQDRDGTIADNTDIAGVLTTQTLGNLINGATEKTTPVDADMLPLMDSAAGNITKKLSWQNVKATLKTYFDTLYSAIGASFYIGTTLIANNRASASQTLTGVSIDGNAATVTTNANLTGNVTSVGNATTIAAGVVTEAMQVLADNTTNNVSTTKHGYAPKAPNDATKFLDGTGAWTVPGSKILTIQDQKASNTQGGTFTSGSWQTRDLNTVQNNTITGSSLTSNQMTLPAGTYLIHASAPAFAVNGHTAKLYNITDASDVIIGTVEYSVETGEAMTRSVIDGVFTIAGSKVFELQHQCITTKTTNGLGAAVNFSVVEVYSIVQITKIG